MISWQCPYTLAAGPPSPVGAGLAEIGPLPAQAQGTSGREQSCCSSWLRPTARTRQEAKFSLQRGRRSLLDAGRLQAPGWQQLLLSPLSWRGARLEEGGECRTVVKAGGRRGNPDAWLPSSESHAQLCSGTPALCLSFPAHPRLMRHQFRQSEVPLENGGLPLDPMLLGGRLGWPRPSHQQSLSGHGQGILPPRFPPACGGSWLLSPGDKALLRGRGRGRALRQLHGAPAHDPYPGGGTGWGSRTHRGTS